MMTNFCKFFFQTDLRLDGLKNSFPGLLGPLGIDGLDCWAIKYNNI